MKKKKNELFFYLLNGQKKHIFHPSLLQDTNTFDIVSLTTMEVVREFLEFSTIHGLAYILSKGRDHLIHK